VIVLFGESYWFLGHCAMTAVHATILSWTICTTYFYVPKPSLARKALPPVCPCCE